MGGLYKKMPVTFVVYLVGALALSGIAPLAGFFSKDEILTAAFHNNLAVMIILLISAFLTAFYMGRQVMLVFFGQPRSSAAQTARENSAIITVPLLVLAALSALGGALNLPWMNNLGNWLAQTFGAVEPEAFLWPMALGSLAVAFTGLLIAWLVYSQRKAQFPGEPDPLRTALGPIYTGMEHKWWVDELYHGVIVRPYQWLAQFTALKVDLGVIDGISAGLAKLTQKSSQFWGKLQNGFVRSYALVMLAGAIIIMTYLVLR
jgi:NADH-quinone oxidoreductase subunit L